SLEVRDLVARALAVSVPAIVFTFLLVLWAAWRCQRSLPPADALAPPLCLFHLGASRWLWLALALLAVGLLVWIPLAGLVWQAGLGGSPEEWSLQRLSAQLTRDRLVHGRLVLRNVAVVLTAGVITGTVALVSCWLAVERRWLQAGLLGLAAIAWSMPAPLVGI